MTLHGLLSGILAAVLLLVALEEISWGQRIFNIASPAYFEQHNVQGEITFHNLDIMKHQLHKLYILTGAYGAFAWLFIRRFVSKAKSNYCHIANFVVPDWFSSPYFFSIFFFYFLLIYYKPYVWSFLRWQDQEPAELLLALGFLSFAVTNYIKLKICLEGFSKSG
jgi:hypothetical protein